MRLLHQAFYLTFTNVNNYSYHLATMASLLAKLHRPLLRPQFRQLVVQRANASSSRKSAYMQSPITWKSVAIAGTFFGSVAIYYTYLKNLKLEQMEKKRQTVIGEAAIQGTFELVDTKGKVRNSQEFKGKWILVYFGFCHCPDVCPEELEKISAVVDRLHADKTEVIPLFITVDPDRDTPELIGKYLAEFSDKFIGLTGDQKQIESATRAFRVYYSPGPKDRDKDYIVDHSIITYLIGPKNELVDYYGQTKDADEMFNTIKYHMKSYRK